MAVTSGRHANGFDLPLDGLAPVRLRDPSAAQIALQAPFSFPAVEVAGSVPEPPLRHCPVLPLEGTREVGLEKVGAVR